MSNYLQRSKALLGRQAEVRVAVVFYITVSLTVNSPWRPSGDAAKFVYLQQFLKEFE